MQISSNMKLTDLNFHLSNEIDLLLGIDVFWELICVGHFKTSPGHPKMQKTRLGWIFAGSFATNDNKNVRVNAFHSSTTNEKLLDQISQFWRIEEIAHPSNAFTIEEMECVNHFAQSVKRSPEG